MPAQPTHTILFVDDNEATRHAWQWILREAGFVVKEAATGTDALRLAAEKPDLIILDVKLPDIDGFEVCRTIRQHPATASVPILHLSAYYTETEDRIQGLESGADGYVVKPVEPRELIAQARSLLRIHHAEEVARQAARQWQTTFDAILDGVCLLDREGNVLRCNAGAARLLGRDPDELLGQDCQSLIPVEGSSLFLRMCESRRRESAEVRVGRRWFRLAADPWVGDKDTLDGAVYTFSDITEHRTLEEQLRQAQKMEAVGRLAGGIAHDFNNLLTAITGNISLLLPEFADVDPRRELLTIVDRAAWRAADLTRQLLGFSRQTLIRPRPLSLGQCIHEVASMLRRTLDPRISLEVRQERELWIVHADPGQMNQVLLNLCLNARDAMPEGGKLHLSAENRQVDEETARLQRQARPGSFVRVQVCDTGCGIETHDLPHIFEPFFTTKPIGKGTGLGLAVASGIVQQHQGWIECTSDPGHGTVFAVYLPRFEDQG